MPFVADGVNGRVSAYTGARDTNLEENPTSDLSRIRFHSDFDYIGFTKVSVQHTVAANGGGFRSIRAPVGGHNKGFTPIVFAILRDWPNGQGTPVDLPLGGGVLIDWFGQRPRNNGQFTWSTGYLNYDRWSIAAQTFRRSTCFNSSWSQKAWTLGATADASNILLWYEQTVFDGSYPATTFNVDFFIGDRSIDGVVGDGAPDGFLSARGAELETASRVELSSTRITAGGVAGGQFNSDRHYFYEDTESPELPMPSNGQATRFDRTASGGLANKIAVLRFAPNWTYRIAIQSQLGVPGNPSTTFHNVGI